MLSLCVLELVSQLCFEDSTSLALEVEQYPLFHVRIALTPARTAHLTNTSEVLRTQRRRSQCYSVIIYLLK